MELYHVMNHGVDERNIFLDTQDYARFVHDLYEFNDNAPALEFHHAISRTTNVGRTTSYIRERIVDIHGWTLMKNHFHLLLSELIDGGMTLFLSKMSGYARYYNKRHGRRGTLFQGRTKKVPVDEEAHALYILHYVHSNPLDYLSGATEWRERDKGAISDIPRTLAYLEKYRWSSYLDYCGTSNFPSILTKTFFDGVFDDDYASTFKEFLHDRVHEDEDLDAKSLEYN
ncbi:hypothetical protein A3J11_01985 [Candidatus Kaiserbacteria bacterium RIFCSPLOWO2_02_FULL_55_12]|uniref:Transposase IS200-like domain-containing protein n=2 Tax=Candidatus Kaiseribacteriota TaxID=1752734 RepID=A0A1F6F1R4_9BACT|nr:MAG: hypothetical protein A3C94_00145 [Candidatus Kaiserbacteria bacterium RIFCSPHIGHO2_02_FULL_55_17]OGG79798.1 MAG: hypothetical protein A3J11_01985 [Candidatus Kaiserbacteria bacterium RIFCSPLOWO2_02_FULL_55_12]